MIATFFLLFAFIRSIRWSRRSGLVDDQQLPPALLQHQQQNGQHAYYLQHLPPLSGQQHQHDIDAQSTTTSASTISTKEAKDKLSSLGQSGHSVFSRSDSTATTTSSSGGTFISGQKRRGDSTASTISTSVFSSEQMLLSDGRRSSEGTRITSHRRSSGRIRRYAPARTTIAGARRRTTGR